MRKAEAMAQRVLSPPLPTLEENGATEIAGLDMTDEVALQGWMHGQ